LRVYSFKIPKKKPIFKEDTKLWLIFIAISLLLYISFSLFLTFKAYILKKETKELNKKAYELKLKTMQLNEEKEFIYIQKSVFENIMIKNDLTKQQIKNLLDLIPDPITLEKFYIDKNKLTIYGITPTKDVYNLLMLPPLKSIFEKTVITFYKLPNGWYRFKSQNYIQSEENETY